MAAPAPSRASVNRLRSILGGSLLSERLVAVIKFIILPFAMEVLCFHLCVFLLKTIYALDIDEELAAGEYAEDTA